MIGNTMQRGAWRIALCAAVAASMLGAGSAALAQAKGGSLDAKAMQILKKMSDYLGKAQRLSFTVNQLYDHVEKSGIKIKQTARTRVVIDRGGKLYAHNIRDDRRMRRVWYDGQTLTRLDVQGKRYVQIAFSGTIDKLIDHVIEKSKMQLPVADFLYSNPAKVFGKNLISARYVGRRIVAGVMAHHLSFESTGADWQIWIKAGDTPVPLRFAIVYVSEKGEPQFLAQFRHWQFNMPVDASLFRAKLPKDAKKIALKEATE